MDILKTGWLILGPVIAFVASYVLAIRKFHTEQWWIRRADSYNKILVALRKFRDCFLVEKGAFDRQAANDRVLSLDDAVDRNVFFVSDKVSKRLSRLENDWNEFEPLGIPGLKSFTGPGADIMKSLAFVLMAKDIDETFESRRKLVVQAYNDLDELAKKELNLWFS